MLSIVNSSHPSCSDSSKDLDPSNDVGHEVQAHPSNFSIRKYVFKSRSKDIRSNWPFREQLLQFCVDNGINDILPPLESPNMVKARYSLKNKTLVLDGGDSKNKASELDQSSTLDSLVVLNPNKKQSKNKCELKDMESSLNNASASMSSKACPVCKSFISSSNTTLNAHIDQCLSSSKSSMTRGDAGSILRPKVNTQKKRLIVDIYKSAKICTLGDLDLRNGTNWAATLAVTIPVNDVNRANDGKYANAVHHSKEANDVIYGKTSNDIAKDLRFGTKMTVPQLDNAREGNVGDIYVDSNGTKLLILSKCNDSSLLISSKNMKIKKHGKGSCTKKLSSQPDSTNGLKNTILRRKINLDKELECEDVVTKVLHSDEAYDEEKESKEDNNCKPLKLGHWVRSKRSSLSRKHSKKILSNEGSKVSTMAPDKRTSTDHTRQTSNSSNIRRTLLLNPSKAFKTAAPPKFKAMKVICSTLNELDNRNSSSQSAPTNLESFSSRESDLPKTCKDKPVKFFTGKSFKKRRSTLQYKNRRVGENDTNINIINSGSHDSTNNFGHTMVQSSKYSKCQVKDIHCFAVLNKDTECSISRYESQVELPTYNDVSLCEDATNNEVVNQDIQISTDQPKIINHDHGECQTNTYSFQDPNHCVTSDGDIEHTQENSTTTSIKTVPSDQDCNVFVELESSVSRVSTTSTISPPSPKKDDKIKDYVAREEDYNAKLSPKAWESSCSCSEITNSHQFVKLPSFSSVDSNLESHYETVNVSQNQSTSNPILRLMGKDLVVSKQASLQNSTMTSCDTREKFISMENFNNAGFRSYNNQYQYNPMQTTSHSYQIPVHHSQIPPLSVLPQYHAREVINFNDICHGDPMGNFTTLSPQNLQNSNVIMPPQRVFSCYPSQNLYASEVFASTQRETTEGTHVYHSPSSLYFAPVLR